MTGWSAGNQKYGLRLVTSKLSSLRSPRLENGGHSVKPKRSNWNEVDSCHES